MTTTELFLIAIVIIFSLPYLVWRLLATDYWAPLVVVQIVAGVVLGPGVLGRLAPGAFHAVFNPAVAQSLNAIGIWAVMAFVWIAGIELDLHHTWERRGESALTAACALGAPLAFGCIAAFMMLGHGDWMGARAQPWQFIVGIGMACAVTAMPILVLLMDKLALLRQPLGQRVLRYASLDDIAIWAVLALILMDWRRVGIQIAFLGAFIALTWGYRVSMRRIPASDRWFVGIIWLALCGLAADLSGLHYMVGAFLAGAVTDADWFDGAQMDSLRRHVLLLLMPIFFLGSGLRTTWGVDAGTVFVAGTWLLAAAVLGKLAGLHLAGKLLKWRPGEASVIGWLLQTKGLIMIIFANILLDKLIITNDTFTALLLMAIGSTMLTTPMVAPKLAPRGEPAARRV